MTRPLHALLVAGTTLACLGWALPAVRAESITYDNNTEVEYYKGTSPYNSGSDLAPSYWDSTPSAGIGGCPFCTPSVTVGMTTSGVDSTVTISFNTGLYAGKTNVSGTEVYAADIFIGSGSSSPTGSYTYAISLGFDSADGGYSTAGLYELPSKNTSNAYETSQQVWDKRTSYIYGGAYAQIGSCKTSSSSCSSAEPSPTVLLDNGDSSGVSGTSVTVSDTPAGKGDSTGTLTITITGLTSLIDEIFDDFDLFWGTGDCSNAPIWENVDLAGDPVPEPSTLALMASALALAAALVRRRRRAALVS